MDTYAPIEADPADAFVATAPRRLYALRWHREQERLKTSTARFKVVPAGRRSGKTELAKRRAVSAFMLATGPDERYFCAAPTRDQAKAIFWHDLKAMIPKGFLGGQPRETELALPGINGAELCVIGMDRPQRMEGRPWDGGILDEFANMKPGVWGENVRPALADRKGWCWLIGVPEGRNHYYDLNKYALSRTDPDWDSFSWHSADILDADEVESARRNLDPLVFQQEYEASFINFEGRCYYPFLEHTHCQPLSYNPKAALILAFDFNVDPGVCAVIQEQVMPGQFELDGNGIPLLDRPVFGTGIIGEVHIPRNSNTPAVCNKIIADWGSHPGIVKLYGDATGGARGSAKVMGSDWDIIKRELGPHFANRLYSKVPASNPPERVRVNSMNTRLKTGAGVIGLMVDPGKAPNTVRDLEGVTVLKGGSGEIDKKADPKLTHLSDAIGYYVVAEFPIVKSTAKVVPLHV